MCNFIICAFSLDPARQVHSVVVLNRIVKNCVGQPSGRICLGTLQALFFRTLPCFEKQSLLATIKVDSVADAQESGIIWIDFQPNNAADANESGRDHQLHWEESCH